MNAKKFSDAMSELDTKYVDEALNYKKKAKKTGWIKWGAMAACLIMIVGIVFWSPTTHDGKVNLLSSRCRCGDAGQMRRVLPRIYGARSGATRGHGAKKRQIPS